ncbi:Nucleoside diphosphate kinase 7, partial [Operophtera brumata]
MSPFLQLYEKSVSKTKHDAMLLQRTFAMIKPIPTKTAGKILTLFHENGLRVTKMKKARLTADDAIMLCRELKTDPTFPFLLDYLTGELVYGMELVGTDAVSVCVKILGDQDPAKAASGTIRALYGLDPVRNCVHASTTVDNAVQPHAVREGKLGAALECIAEGGFDVTALN